MIYTINEIEVGDWVTTAYDKGNLIQVTWVNKSQDEFHAMDWDNHEKWERLCSDDVTKLRKGSVSTDKRKIYESAN